MKISIIGAGNVGGLLAEKLLGFNLEEILLVDINEDLAKAKALDLEDSASVFRYNSCLKATSDIKEIVGSEILVITAGLSRKPGMQREDLLKLNAKIVKEISLKIKELTPEAIVLVVTNPVDIITYLVLKISGFLPSKVLGVGANLDSIRFLNLISKELKISPSDIETLVIGAHGETMLCLERFTFIKGVALNNFLDPSLINEIKQKTINRGKDIVSLYKTSSAYFGPSSAILEVIKTILKNERKRLPVSCYLNGEYGIEDICIGVPCILGKKGIERIIELELNKEEKELFLKSVESLKLQRRILKEDGIL